MEREKMLGILKALADGVDPATGEQFPAASPYQHPDTVRALFSAIHVLEGSSPAGKTGPQHKTGPENAGRPWSEEEDLHLAKAYDAGKPVDALAQAHKRSKWAIEARLVRLGKISAPPSGFASRQSRANPATGAEVRS